LKEKLNPLWEEVLFLCPSTEPPVGPQTNGHISFAQCCSSVSLQQPWFLAVCINRAFYGGPQRTWQCLHLAFMMCSSTVFTVTQGGVAHSGTQRKAGDHEIGMTSAVYRWTRQKGACVICRTCNRRMKKHCWYGYVCEVFPCSCDFRSVCVIFLMKSHCTCVTGSSTVSCVFKTVAALSAPSSLRAIFSS